ncbi:GNAT family N-acetyltransferase [Lapillicoccus jejuensis]|uniref:RimJ/RimL family protein N-acetyltransferase n=1 Tax=Lapillicoccus jejuensis TaxID=402171 RepID=A0A542E4U1_9MICO|nr:GNAT family protein [Lapillicoccus jejuensis]TQJ10337.1 RimJ/RimL family protein N-acetyltransferase [Lapillicoccus jejuensis]
MLTIEEIFPPFALRIIGGPVEMRVLRDGDIPELVELVRSGVQTPGLPMPFLRDWHTQPFDPGAPGGFPTESLAWWWRQRSTISPQEWHLALVVRSQGRVVGMQDLRARGFDQTRHVESGSWLGLEHQGRGTGTLMRRLAVGFAFQELGARSCGSGYIAGNHASAAVSRKVGYIANGIERIVQQTSDGPVGVDEQRVLVTPATYVAPQDPVEVHGAEQLRRFLGITRG